MWQEKLQDAVTSHPWLEPHQDIKRKSQAPGMQLVVSDIVVDTPGKIIYRPLDQNRFISIQLAESFPRQLTLKRNRAIVFPIAI